MHDRLDAVIALRAEMLRNSATWCFLPKRWENSKATKNLAWSRPRRWNPTNVAGIPDNAGVYAFLLIPEITGAPDGIYVLYIGMSQKQGLRTRYTQYAHEMKRSKGRVRIQVMLSNWPKHLWYCYAVTPEAKAKAAEKKLRRMLVPPFNNDIDADVNAAKKAF
jgi:hypothetical protein